MLTARFLLTALLLTVAAHCPAAEAGQSNAAGSEESQQLVPFVERNVTYINSAAGIVLGGSFTRPLRGGPFPAVLLIAGSGPHDRDESMGRHKFFQVLAEYLTRRGLAVLRVDSRGTGASTGDFSKATTQDLASDAEAGVTYLMGKPDVDPKHIGLIGHGEGALIAPMIAGKMPQIAFLVLLATPALPGEQVLLTQRERAERAAHMPEAEIALDKKIATTLYDLVRQGKNGRALEHALSKYEETPGDLANLWRNQLPRLDAPWLRFFLSYDPAPALERIKCPVLALEGEKDMDVSPEQNVPALKAAFARGGNPDATVEVLPGLNYFFQTAESGLPMEYPVIPETISRVALDKIGMWIVKHTSEAVSE